MKKTKHEHATTAPDDLPLKPVMDELAFVRKTFRDTATQYVTQIESEISAIRETVAATAAKKKVPAERLRGLRDILLILRGLDVKSEKGRRRDLKKIESAVDELRRIVDGWD